jgi:hypothetical protein
MVHDRLFDQWKKDWRENRRLFWLEMTGTLSSIVASVLVSFWAGRMDLFWVFLFWLIGSLSLALAAYIRSTAWPMLLMVIYTIFNVIGLYNTL